MTELLKKQVQTRANACCEYCLAQEYYSHDPFSAEHIYPISKGGTDDLENLAWACLGCNLYKYNFITAVDTISGTIVPLYNPRQNIWSDHFEWHDNFTLLQGLTPIGRATIQRLQLNRQGLVNLREVLRSSNKHPPLIYPPQ
jgi:HNH endonuclease